MSAALLGISARLISPAPPAGPATPPPTGDKSPTDLHLRLATARHVYAAWPPPDAPTLAGRLALPALLSGALGIFLFPAPSPLWTGAVILFGGGIILYLMAALPLHRPAPLGAH